MYNKNDLNPYQRTIQGVIDNGYANSFELLANVCHSKLEVYIPSQCRGTENYATIPSWTNNPSTEAPTQWL